jgi:hypothetical protein
MTDEPSRHGSRSPDFHYFMGLKKSDDVSTLCENWQQQPREAVAECASTAVSAGRVAVFLTQARTSLTIFWDHVRPKYVISAKDPAIAKPAQPTLICRRGEYWIEDVEAKFEVLPATIMSP